MIRRLDNKGLTAIEVLVCFSLVSIIVISMFNVVNNYKNKQTLESFKTTITTYKTTLTKTIYDDILKNEGIKKVVGPNKEDNDSGFVGDDFETKIELNYISGKNAEIYIKSNTSNSEYYVLFTSSDGAGSVDKFELPSISNLRFNAVYADVVEETNFINIHIGLWHPEFGTDYDALNIVVPNVEVYPGMLG